MPQGSILGPSLLVLYTVYMVKSVDCDIHQFGDDTQVYARFSKNRIGHARNITPAAVGNITDYSTKQGLKLNATKTKFTMENFMRLIPTFLFPILI